MEEKDEELEKKPRGQTERVRLAEQQQQPALVFWELFFFFFLNRSLSDPHYGTTAMS